MGDRGSGITEAMSANDRVRRSRWVNKVEAAADELLALLRSAPDPLPRMPVFDPELLDTLSRFSMNQDDDTEANYPSVRFLELGNGNQIVNRRRALACAVRVFDGAEALDEKTIKLPEWGTCRFAAFTHPQGAMISSTKKEDTRFGSLEWHKRDHFVMFRDVGDGRCVIYICDIEPLFSLRTIGHHGVKWDDVRKIAKAHKVVSSSDALAAELMQNDWRTARVAGGMSKYDQLQDYFSQRADREFILSFAEIENIAGFELPKSARIYAPWWANEATHSTTHVQCRAWCDAGYSAFPEMENQRVRFVRMQARA